MEPKIIGLIVGGPAIFGLMIWAAFRLRRRTLRKYHAKFAEIGPGQTTESSDSVRYVCTYQGRRWRLEALVPMVLKSSASLTREETQRFVAHVALAQPAPLGLYVVMGSRWLTAHATRRFDKQRVPIADEPSYFVGATEDARGLFTPELQAQLVRIYRLPMIDLELVIEPGGRSVTCSKLYGFVELAPLLTAIGELVDILERAWSTDPYRSAPRPAGGQARDPA